MANYRHSGALLLLLAGLLSLLASPAMALERILSYHSDIQIESDSSMTVHETIRVVAEGDQIRRGIYRDFPTTYKDRYGNRIKVDFEVTGVTMDGGPESWHTKRRSNGVRIYAGNPDVILTPGEYTYRFSYRTDRQIGFFESHDELYWNVTGNGWNFIIERAGATIRLPVRVSSQDITLAGFTGLQGSTENASVLTVSDSTGAIQTTHELEPRAGLTVVMGWPKGVVAEPDASQRLGYFIGDNLGLLLATIALLGSALYLYIMWSRHGRDPAKGVIFPHYEPPRGYSPASARFINELGYDRETFTAAIINLAVKGHVKITCDDDEYTLKRTPSPEPLAPAEDALITSLFRDSRSLKLENSNHQRVAAAKSAHKTALKRDYLNHYFKTNAMLLLPSLIVSLLLLFVIVSTALFVPVIGALYVGNLLLHVLFGYLLKAPSRRGRRLMDKLAGFKLYLEVAEKDDLNLRHPPDMTPRLFEKYLPFAIALGVEQAWAEQFTKVFARLETKEGSGYHPAWYSGSFNSSRMSNFTSSISSDLSSAISSASTAPGSSSGSSGGGFSGGGGGGGGGGGW